MPNKHPYFYQGKTSDISPIVCTELNLSIKGKRLTYNTL